MNTVLAWLHEIQDGSLVAKGVFTILAVQMTFLFLLYFAHCLISLAQSLLSPRRDQRKKDFDEFIARLLLESMKDSETRMPLLPPKYYWFERSAVQEMLFLHLRELKGDSKTALFRLYRELGFFKIDMRQMFSKKWWIRLRTAIRLQHIGIMQSERALKKLRNDPSPMVANLVTQHFGSSEKRQWQRSL